MSEREKNAFSIVRAVNVLSHVVNKIQKQKNDKLIYQLINEKKK